MASSHRVPITVRVESFEGPLDLLLYLIQTHELDISKVSISRITDQYLAYVRLMQELNFDVASEFLVMAATLIQWKSKAILPQEDKTLEGAEDGEVALSPEELLRQLLEHQRFRQVAGDMLQLSRLGEDVFTRPNRRPPIERIWKEMDVTSLATTYQQILVREKKRTTILKKETVSLSEKIVDFADKIDLGEMKELRSLMRNSHDKPEIVVTFLAALELARLKRFKVHQEKTYSEIWVEVVQSLKNFNLDLASGFDSVEAAVQKKTEEEAAEAEALAAAQAQISDDPATAPALADWDPMANPPSPPQDGEILPAAHTADLLAVTTTDELIERT
jgi:segregation and condensation protein A